MEYQFNIHQLKLRLRLCGNIGSFQCPCLVALPWTGWATALNSSWGFHKWFNSHSDLQSFNVVFGAQPFKLILPANSIHYVGAEFENRSPLKCGSPLLTSLGRSCRFLGHVFPGKEKKWGRPIIVCFILDPSVRRRAVGEVSALLSWSVLLE